MQKRKNQHEFLWKQLKWVGECEGQSSYTPLCTYFITIMLFGNDWHLSSNLSAIIHRVLHQVEKNSMPTILILGHPVFGSSKYSLSFFLQSPTIFILVLRTFMWIPLSKIKELTLFPNDNELVSEFLTHFYTRCYICEIINLPIWFPRNMLKFQTVKRI